MAIFSHKDCDGDSIELLAEGGDPQENLVLLYSPHTGAAAGGVRIDREAAERLHNALGEWMYPQNLGPTPGDYAAAVRTLTDSVHGLATSIRPLWSAPVAAACRCHDNEGNSVLPDPEPRDVGHPEPLACICMHSREYPHTGGGCTCPGCECMHEGAPAPEPLCTRTCPENAHLASRCTFCGHLWGDHAGSVYPDPTPLERVREFYRSTLAPEAVVPAPRQLVGCECGHRWSLHSSSKRLGCFATGKDYEGEPLVCGCRRTWPNLHSHAGTELCRCGDLTGVHDVAGCRAEGCKCTGVVPRVKCTCAHPRQVHGPHGCGYLGECSCKYVGEGP